MNKAGNRGGSTLPKYQERHMAFQQEASTHALNQKKKHLVEVNVSFPRPYKQSSEVGGQQRWR